MIMYIVDNINQTIKPIYKYGIARTMCLHSRLTQL